jgi:hypothetical protein
MESSFYNNFLVAMAARYPRKADLTNALMKLLPLERESVYRRLRGDVSFTFEEVMQIARAWSISIDNIICSSPGRTKPFQYNMVNFVDPEEEDYKVIDDYHRMISLIAGDATGQMTEALNTLPTAFFYHSELLSRFLMMRWRFQTGAAEEIRTLREIAIPEELRKRQLSYCRHIATIPRIHYICDFRLFEYLTEEIGYFLSIRLIDSEDVAMLHDELLALSTRLEEVVTRGHFPDSNGKLSLYVSHTSFETGYTLYESKDILISMVRLFVLTAISSRNREAFLRLKRRSQSTIRSSVLISVSNELQRIEFFNRQREIIGRLAAGGR